MLGWHARRINGVPGWAWTMLALVGCYVVLLVPDTESAVPLPPERAPFRWDRDAFWNALEQRFQVARQRPCRDVMLEVNMRRQRVEGLVARLPEVGSSDTALADLRDQVFALGPLLAACPEHLSWFSPLQARLRAALEGLRGVASSATNRELLYQLAYGSRAVLEEAQLQAPMGDPAFVQQGSDESSATPSVEIRGVRLHSGDLWLSRGGAPTSALIARGNDFPGNFSHVAIVHVDRDVSIVEAHIESGVEVATVDDYLADRKLRVMVLRPRASLPALRDNPMLPHQAATAALERARREHVAYDFAMDASDTSRLFCSEVASSVYEPLGVRLWSEPSHMSDAGLRAWLSSLGVRHFTTQAPSDLEYDPALRVVAEWRNPAALFDARVDNAIIEALLDNVGDPKPLPYSKLGLPFVRVAKAFSLLVNAFGMVGPVPEGMNATAAARVRYFSSYHATQRERLMLDVEAFEADNGYRPPYWRLVQMAGELVRESPL